MLLFLLIFGQHLYFWNSVLQMVFMAVLIEFQRLFFVVSCLSLCLQTNPDVCLLLQKTRSKVRDSSRTKNRTTQISIKVYWIFEERRKKKLEQHICYFDKCYGVAKLSIFLVILNHKTAGLISFCLDNID